MFKLFRSFFQPKESEIEIQHDEFGLLKLDGSLWSGAVVRDGRKVQFFIEGTSLGPDDRLVATLQEVIQHFPERENEARAFIASHDPLIAADSFTFCSINIFWPKRPECYYFDTLLSGYKSNSFNWLRQAPSGFGTEIVESA